MRLFLVGKGSILALMFSSIVLGYGTQSYASSLSAPETNHQSSVTAPKTTNDLSGLSFEVTYKPSTEAENPNYNHSPIQLISEQKPDLLPNTGFFA